MAHSGVFLSDSGAPNIAKPGENYLPLLSTGLERKLTAHSQRRRLRR